MRPVLTVSEMNAVDDAARRSTPLDVLVGRAGRAVAVAALDMLGRHLRPPGGGGRRAGQQRCRRTGGRRLPRASRGQGLRPRGGRGDRGRPRRSGHRCRLRHRLPRPVPPARGLRPGTPVLAVDIPSGVDGDTGDAGGSPWAALRTVTFVALKPGLVQGEGARLAGEVSVVDIGLPPGDPPVWVMEDPDIGALVPPRRHAGQQVVGGRPGGGRVPGHDRRGRPLCPVGLSVRGGHGPPGRARR